MTAEIFLYLCIKCATARI